MATRRPQIPRIYQTELLEEAKHRNIIIRADTGVGKTLVAVLLIRWIASQPRLAAPDGSIRHKIQVFLVPTRHLADQQFNTISEQLSLRVCKYTGDMQPELWPVEKWKTELYSVFLDVLSNGFWNMEHISLIVFDEAHHCNKNHPYNQLMGLHYHPLRQSGGKEIPRILAMTASPIWSFDSEDVIKQHISVLQHNLDAKLYEVQQNRANLSSFTSRPKERVILYEQSSFDITLPFRDELATREGVQSNVERLMATELDGVASALAIAVKDIGPMAELLYIRGWIDKQLGSTQSIIDPIYRMTLDDYRKEFDRRIASAFADPQGMTPKVHALVDCLLEYEAKMASGTFAGIIFVERRLHVQILASILEQIEDLRGFVIPVALTGHASQTLTVCMTHIKQERAVQAFRQGMANLAIATSVAEEGLDFRACCVVIRFDDIVTWKGYIQSRGRTRATDSEYIVMIDRNKQAANKYFDFAGKWNQVNEDIYANPPDDASDSSDDMDTSANYYVELDDDNHSVLTRLGAPGLVNKVCQLLEHDEYTPNPRPVYVITEVNGLFKATVTLPAMAELPPDGRLFQGSAMPTKKGSKRSAAFEACKALHHAGVLTDHLLPSRKDIMTHPVDADGRPLDSEPVGESVKARCANPFGKMQASQPWIHRIAFDFGEERVTCALVCGNRIELPESIALYDHQQEGRCLPVVIEGVVQTSWPEADVSQNLTRLDTFTRTGIQVAVNRRSYEGELFFFLAPLLKSTLDIDWDLVDKPVLPTQNIDEVLSLTHVVAPLRALHDRLLSVQGHCESVDIKAPCLELPEVPKMEWFRKKVTSQRFKSLDHYYAVAMSLPLEVTTTPLVFLGSVTTVQNNLRPFKKIPTFPHRVLILPQAVCQRSRLPLLMWRFFNLLPSITRLVHDALQAQTVMRTFVGDCRMDVNLIIEALTPPGATNVGFDYQTLETVGDSFLKLATSVHLYISKPMRGEGTLSILRSKSVDNAFLRGKAMRAGIPNFVLGQRFRTDQFCAAHLENGKPLEDGTFERTVPRRVLSDVVEALLGAAYLSGGVNAALQMGTGLDLCFGGTSPWGMRSTRHRSGEWSVGPSMLALQDKLGYTFRQPYLVIQALTHRSANAIYTDQLVGTLTTNCYEREEWIGDAVLDLWITEHLYRRFPRITAEQLTFIRASIVSNGSLGFLALRKLDLQKLILHNATALEDACRRAHADVEVFPDIANFYEDHNNSFTAFDPPKILGDVVEAVIGAAFVDSGYDLPRVFQMLDRVFEDVLPVLKQCAPRDPLSRTLQLRDRHFCNEFSRKITLEAEVTDKEELAPKVHVCEITLHGNVIATGHHATSASVAEQRAAKIAVGLLSDESTWAACHCGEARAEKERKAKKRKKQPRADSKANAKKAVNKEREALMDEDIKQDADSTAGTS